MFPVSLSVSGYMYFKLRTHPSLIQTEDFWAKLFAYTVHRIQLELPFFAIGQIQSMTLSDIERRLWTSVAVKILWKASCLPKIPQLVCRKRFMCIYMKGIKTPRWKVKVTHNMYLTYLFCIIKYSLKLRIVFEYLLTIIYCSSYRWQNKMLILLYYTMYETGFSI